MVSVYYKFKSSKDFHSIPIDGPFISVSAFKDKIFASKRYGNGNDFDLLISDVQTDQQYNDGSILIAANSSLLIRRTPGIPQLPIVIGGEKPKTEKNPSSVVKDLQEEEGFDSHDFGLDFNSIPKNSTLNPSNIHCKEEKIDYGFRFLPVKGFGKGQIPPQGYVCHRCKVAGHYIQHCPTNGDPRFDFKRGNPTTGISNAFASASASASTNSSCSVGNNIPLELYCPLCKKVMKDAVLTKCCFASFCDKCIRDLIVSMSVCVCQRKIVADDILPNKTVRDTISRILNQSGDTSSEANTEEKEIQQKKADSGEAEQKRKRKVYNMPNDSQWKISQHVGVDSYTTRNPYQAGICPEFMSPERNLSMLGMDANFAQLQKKLRASVITIGLRRPKLHLMHLQEHKQVPRDFKSSCFRALDLSSFMSLINLDFLILQILTPTEKDKPTSSSCRCLLCFSKANALNKSEFLIKPQKLKQNPQKPIAQRT
ncbi:E3 ubiquitin ligase PARAQUAT TOLERANCE 3-like [Durio zibethinus]|uniref:E3 ubiquitin ligase PARAQUAT TOLERANCE 3-like n=1 Tax=Durio zibethinus TaxID=66656 RepID=A0A6P5ZFK0_DURZI|nr:E3 ubiquitin ligase PARAQUAT TOLERANCE 3-like [Durio zibethinus]